MTQTLETRSNKSLLIHNRGEGVGSPGLSRKGSLEQYPQHNFLISNNSNINIIEDASGEKDENFVTGVSKHFDDIEHK